MTPTPKPDPAFFDIDPKTGAAVVRPSGGDDWDNIQHAMDQMSGNVRYRRVGTTNHVTTCWMCGDDDRGKVQWTTRAGDGSSDRHTCEGECEDAFRVEAALTAKRESIPDGTEVFVNYNQVWWKK